MPHLLHIAPVPAKREAEVVLPAAILMVEPWRRRRRAPQMEGTRIGASSAIAMAFLLRPDVIYFKATDLMRLFSCDSQQKKIDPLLAYESSLSRAPFSCFKN